MLIVRYIAIELLIDMIISFICFIRTAFESFLSKDWIIDSNAATNIELIKTVAFSFCHHSSLDAICIISENIVTDATEITATINSLFMSFWKSIMFAVTAIATTIAVTICGILGNHICMAYA